jgi:alpha-mannosidase
VLDTLLVVRGESARTFRLGVGFELAAPAAAALQFMGPATVVPATVCPAEPAQRWFHFDARNVVALRWQPVLRDAQAVGFRVRLLETAGEDTTLHLRSFRPIVKASKLDAGEPSGSEVPVEAGQASLTLHRHEWAWIECLYS